MKQKGYRIFSLALLIVFLTIGTPEAISQTVYGSDKTWTGKETKEEKWQKMIDIDMSVPDFKSKKIDQEVMGCRLAKMIDFIQKNYKQGGYNRRLAQIRYEQTEDPRIRFANIDRVEYLEAEKKDSIILLKWHTFTKLENKEKVNYDITMRFINGISDNEAVNDLFSDISRFIQPEEE